MIRQPILGAAVQLGLAGADGQRCATVDILPDIMCPLPPGSQMTADILIAMHPDLKWSQGACFMEDNQLRTQQTLAAHNECTKHLSWRPQMESA